MWVLFLFWAVLCFFGVSDFSGDSVIDTIPSFAIFLLVGIVVAIIALRETTGKTAKKAHTQHNSIKKKENRKQQEHWEDYPAPNYQAIHTYCSVTFENSKKVFYYRTRNPQLKVGDLVYVPVGFQQEKKIGRIVSMKDYVGSHAPYPLEKTKFIISKVS